MHTICPNCLRPVRAGAKYCGFCGTTLNSVNEAEAAASIALQEDAIEKGKGKKKAGSSNERTNQGVTTVAIVLLFVVIIAALVIRYWPEILLWMDQILPWLNIR